MTGAGSPGAELQALVVASSDDAAAARALLDETAIKAALCPGVHDAVARLAHKAFDAIILVASTVRQLDAIAKLRQRAPGVAVIVLAARGDRAFCDTACSRGAHDALLMQDLAPRVLEYAVRLAIEIARSDRNAAEEPGDAGFRAIFDLDAHPVWICDPASLRILSANRAATEAYGYSEEQFQTMTFTDLRVRGRAAPEDVPRGRPVLGKHRTRDGREIEVEVFAEETTLSDRGVLLARVRDVTAERRAMRVVETSERRFRDFFEQSTGFIFIHELDGTLLSVNPAAASALGRSVAELLGTSLRDLAAPHLRFLIDQYMQRIAEKSEDAGLMRVQHRDGSELVLQYRNKLYTNGDGSAYVMGYAQDITAMRAVEQALKLSEQRLRTVADTLPLKIAYFDARLRLVFANQAFRRTYALEKDGEGVGQHAREVLGESHYGRREPFLMRALAGDRVVFEDEEGEGEDYRCVEVTFIPEMSERDSGVVGVHSMVHDITSKKREERRLIHLAKIDPLSGLMNRSGFDERLQSAIERSREKDWLLSVFYLDIDRFKEVNDTHGHPVGDALIRAFATRLGQNVRASDTVARIGGDEFIVVMEGIPDIKRVRTIATKLVMAMSRPFELRSEGVVLNIGASVGVAACQGCPTAADQLVARADAMLYEAKQAGRGTYRLELLSPVATGQER
jgi:diguanylate cyclase (GGDEF)-like protein/PAS domain S-box-containing protein